MSALWCRGTCCEIWKIKLHHGVWMQCFLVLSQDIFWSAVQLLSTLFIFVGRPTSSADKQSVTCLIHVQIKVAIIDILIRLSSSVGIKLPFLIPSFIILGSLQTYLFQPPLFILHIKHLSPTSIHALHFPACPHLCQPPLHYEYQEIHLSPDLDWQPLCISSLIVVDPTGTSLQTHITQSSSSSWTNGIFSSPPSIRSLSVISFKDS